MDIETLVAQSIQLKKWPLGRLLRVFEDTRAEAVAARQEVIRRLDEAGCVQRALFIGVTGTPGSGKSSLLGVLANKLLAMRAELKVAVLAIDPSSPLSGGTLLGDRVRVRVDAHSERFFFRSQPSDCRLGGVGRHTFQLCRVLGRLFDIVCIETVGIGQSEMDVRQLVDRLYLVMQPLAGDQVQFIKSGIMEIPDVFVLNKCDQEDIAKKSLYTLRSSLRLFSKIDPMRRKILQTSAHTGEGSQELAEDVLEAYALPTRCMTRQHEHAFRVWVQEAFGALGMSCLRQLEAEDVLTEQSSDFEDSQCAFRRLFFDWILAQRHTTL